MDRSPASASPHPVVTRYAFSLAASAVAAMFALWAERGAPGLISPFLPAFAAVIASAAWAGFGPGIVSTVVLTVWCGYLADAGHPASVSGILLRGAVFFLEGLMICAGSAKLMRAVGKATRSEEWHRSLVETSAEGIWVLDNAGLVIYANPRMAEILGTTLAAVLGHSYEDFLFPPDWPAEKVRFAHRDQNPRQQFDRRLRKADGAEAWVLACSNVTRIVTSPQPGVLTMMTDITERKRAEQALRRSEARFRSLFDNVLEGVYQSSPDGRILAANPMLLKMLGLTSEAEMNDVNIATDLYVDPETRRKFLHRLERDGSLQNVDYELRRRGGEVISVQENARVVRDEEGRALYYEGTLTDITERKRMDQRLRQAQKMEAIGRLAGGIAHDFNNILTVITGHAQLTADLLQPQHPARQSADQVLGAAVGAAALTRQLMTFSRRQSHDPAIVDINRIVRHTEPELRNLLGNAIELRLHLDTSEVAVMADSGHIEQILLNLALRARSTARISALILHTSSTRLDAEWCELHPGAQPGNWAVLRLECSPLAGVQSASTAPPGASTAQAIVSQYGGFLMPGETPGCEGGSVYLPLAEGAPAAPDPGSLAETVLLVEDEPLIRELSRDMLERQGFRVLVAAGPLEAEAISQRSRFDMLITDVTMPDINGPELARRLRQARPGLKVLYISGYSDLPLNPLELESAGAGLLQKPFSADSLGRKIRQMLGSR